MKVFVCRMRNEATEETENTRLFLFVVFSTLDDLNEFEIVEHATFNRCFFPYLFNLNQTDAKFDYPKPNHAKPILINPNHAILA